MSTVTNESIFVFNTDLGNILTKTQDVSGYDVEDIISDKAFSQAQILKFEQTAESIDVNARKGARAIGSSYLPEE